MESCNLGKDVRDGDCVEHPISLNKGKELIISNDGDAPTDDELSSGRSPSMSPPPRRNARGSTRAKSRRKHSPRIKERGCTMKEINNLSKLEIKRAPMASG